MNMLEAMSKEFEHECAITRRVLERIPEASYGWKPHEKSWPAAGLAAHIANLAGWVVPTLDEAGLDLDPSAHGTWLPAGRADLLAKFDANAAASQECLRRHNTAVLGEMWTFTSGGKPVFTHPKVVVLRGFVFSHLIHHRGQLAVYLRLLNVPVPAIYGPSADENPFDFK